MARAGVTQAVSNRILPAVMGTVFLGGVVLSAVVKGFFIELLPS
jgi:hypothetical protein